jgi:hypothetical protein
MQKYTQLLIRMVQHIPNPSSAELRKISHEDGKNL